MKFIRPVWFFLLFFLLSLTRLQHAQQDYEVRSIEFNGNHTFSSARLLEEMSMFGSNGFQKTFLRKKPFKYAEEFVQSDIDKLLRFYQREGFLHVSISKPQLDLDQEKKTVNMTFRIQEGEPVAVDSVYFHFRQDSLVAEEEVGQFIRKSRSSLKLKGAERFRDEDAQSDQQKLNEQLVNNGYPYSVIERELTVKKDENRVDITWRIDSGPKSKFGGVVVKGNETVTSDMIFKQLAFKEGQTYERRLIDKSQQQLYALGIFRIATVKAILTQDKNSVIPVVIQIQEAPKFTTKLGLGYGTEEKFRVSSDSRRLSFLGGARQLNLFLKHSQLEPYKAELQFIQPAFITPKTVFTTNLFIRKENEPGFSVQRKGGSASVIQPIIRYLDGSVTYLLEQVIQDTTDVSQAKTTEQGFEDLYNKSSIILGLRHDSSRPLFTPLRGLLSIFTFKISGVGLNTAYDYLSALWDVRRYQTFSGKVIAFRLKIGAITPYSENDFIPSEDRFYAGGSSSVRGWGRSLLGPLDAEGKPIGGNSLLEGSAEPRFPVLGPLSGVFFIDFGNVWLNSFTYRLDEIRYSWGVGLRYSTPIGPVRLDVAKPIFDDENRVQFYISVGHAF